MPAIDEAHQTILKLTAEIGRIQKYSETLRILLEALEQNPSDAKGINESASFIFQEFQEQLKVIERIIRDYRAGHEKGGKK